MKRKLQIQLSILTLFAVVALVAFNQTEKDTTKSVPCLKCCIKEQQGCTPEPKNSNTDYIFYESLNGHLISAAFE